jgi:hypothetical protein
MASPPSTGIPATGHHVAIGDGEQAEKCLNYYFKCLAQFFLKILVAFFKEILVQFFEDMLSHF